jgi:cellobiose epimerase
MTIPGHSWRRSYAHWNFMATADQLDNSSTNMRSEMESALSIDLRENWFPRVIDPDGGYTENLDRKWRPTGDNARHLVHQARLAWTAAAYAAHAPDVHAQFGAYALYGIHFIDRVFRDREHGGFYYDVALDGRPLRNGDKNAYATAFAIFGAAKAYSVTHEGRALEVAREGFAWLDRHSYREGKGYVEDSTRDGSPILTDNRANPLGYRYGDVTSNSHLHLLEAFTELHRADPDPVIRERLGSIFLMMRDRFVTSDGRLLHRLDDDSLFASNGHAVEAAYLLVDAADALGMRSDVATREVAARLSDRVLTHGRDPTHGGLLNEPDKDRGVKISWVQAEALNTWIMMARHESSGANRWSVAAEEQWSFIRDHLIDRKYGGWYWQTTRRGWRSGSADKSGEWQDPYHTTRALLNGLNG